MDLFLILKFLLIVDVQLMLFLLHLIKLSLLMLEIQEQYCVEKELLIHYHKIINHRIFSRRKEFKKQVDKLLTVE